MAFRSSVAYCEVTPWQFAHGVHGLSSSSFLVPTLVLATVQRRDAQLGQAETGCSCDECVAT